MTRQRLRWSRSWCWGTLWLLRRPVQSADFLFTITQTLGIAVYGVSILIAVLGAVTGAISVDLLLQTLLTAAMIAMLSHLRYIVGARLDEPLHRRVTTWLVSPLTSAPYLGLFLPLYYVAMLRPRPQQGWGTRKQVEVGLYVEPAAEQAPSQVHLRAVKDAA